MDKFVNYKDVPFGDRDCWTVEYEPVWGGEGKVMGWKPKARVYVRGGRADVVFADLNPNYELRIDDNGCIYLNGKNYIKFDSTKPVESRGLYDLYIDNHIDIPDSIPKDSPCYRQFMNEKEGV